MRTGFWGWPLRSHGAGCCLWEGEWEQQCSVQRIWVWGLPHGGTHGYLCKTEGNSVFRAWRALVLDAVEGKGWGRSVGGR